MKILIVNTQAPFIRGGAEYLAKSLRYKLQECGHKAEIVQIPFKWYPAQVIPQQIIACRLFNLEIAEPDLVIALKFPTYYVPFKRKKLWLLHQFRQVYELWGTPFQDLPDTPEGRRVRDMIVQADNRYLREVQEIYTNSKIVARRLKTYNDINATAVLYPPLLHPEQFHSGDFGNYFFYPSRVVQSKRQELAIAAMHYVKSDFKLIIAGQPETEVYGQTLQEYISRHKLEDKVKMLGWITDEQKAELMANAFGALYIPYDEDSYGYVTLEAFYSHKPVITLTDSGGTDEVIEDGYNGLILAPSAETLAEGMEQMWANRQKTIKMGQNAYGTLHKYNISWDYVLENLTS